MSIWLRLITLSLIIGFCKGAQLLKLIILTVLGLAGLWMLHILAEDFGNIYSNFVKPDKKPVARFFFKRSIDDGSYYLRKTTPKPENFNINWERILSNDVLACTQSYICQLVPTKSEKLLKEEKAILFLVRSASSSNNWASKKLYEALKYGEKIKNRQACRIKYKLCPFSSEAMTSILKLIGKT